MDVLNGGVVHAACPSGFRIQGTLEHGSEDGGRNLAPVEIVRGTLENKIPDSLVETRYL